ncbi:MAG: transcription-repair coupling factor [Acholeplasmatales bacterium]|jgi:transcription-repair coupling factor (superfamily II helicase)|nr:transcription-repair coupling factor [Acholeplasmatales bacterium]
MKFIDFLINETSIYNKYINTKNRSYNLCKEQIIELLAIITYYKENKTIFLVLPNLFEAQKYYDNLVNIVSPDIVLFYPGDQILTKFMSLGSFEFKSERLYTIRHLLTNNHYIVVTDKQSFTIRQLSPKDYLNSIYNLEKNKDYDISKITRLLEFNGYKRSYTVEKKEEYSIRGNIIDIYGINDLNPVRLDFFGNTLENIKEFDIQTQRSIKNLSLYELVPISEVFYNDIIMENALENINLYFDKSKMSKKEIEKLENDITNITLRKKLDTLICYIPFFNKQNTTIADFKDDKNVFIIDLEKHLTNDAREIDDFNAYTSNMGGDVFTSIPIYNNIKSYIKENTFIFDNSSYKTKINMYIPSNYDGDTKNFVLSLKGYSDYTRIIYSNTQIHYESIKSALEIASIEYSTDIVSKNICVLKEYCNLSLILPDEKLYITNEENIFNTKQKTKIHYRSVLNESRKIHDISEISPGDYVVHYEYGIGKYHGLITLSTTGVKIDYLKIEYANNEILYVPIDKVENILKYGSYNSSSPSLSSLSNKSWSKTKTNIKKKIKDMSDRLLQLYAKKELETGNVYAKDTAEQILLEEDFEFDETIDQKKAIEDVKKDMESKKIMDRLIIGDVGYGKTEVAIRAAFKAVNSNKQVAYLVPTTVLARQHFYTFKERLEKYGVNVALLSRFVSVKEQHLAISGLEKGNVDIVIGTHRLLSKDIKFKDLGLFIIDEEQRFGVSQKIKINELKSNIDVLILTATPIPRTLQMSLMGLRDFSVIETAPTNRYPVQTYVTPREDGLIKEAIRRELARAGQVFYLYNNTRDIEKIVASLSKLVPEAKITFAHGQMDKTKIENTISSFIEHKADILVSTTIIETGIDIPNANTLLIHDADKLGLTQLYQIRGRVGRSDKIAYAYLFYEKNKIMGEDATRRLEAIEDFTELGSGYKIASRDLAIRGAGDLLGSEQSGFIDSVGLELYSKLLYEVINNIDVESLTPKESDSLNYSNEHIDKEYIGDDVIRVEIHKRISRINSISDLHELENELKDRFGSFSDDLKIYMQEKLYKKLGYKMGIIKTSVTSKEVTLQLSSIVSAQISGQKLFKLASEFKNIVSLSYIDEKINIKINITKINTDWLVFVNEFITKFLFE